MTSTVGDEQPPTYESLIRGDRHNPSYVDMSGPNYQSIIDTEAYYLFPNPSAGPTSVNGDLTPSPTSIETNNVTPSPLEAPPSVERDVTPNLPAAPINEDRRNVTPNMPVAPNNARNSTLYDNVEDKTVYPDADMNEPGVDRNTPQDR